MCLGMSMERPWLSSTTRLWLRISKKSPGQFAPSTSHRSRRLEDLCVWCEGWETPLRREERSPLSHVDVGDWSKRRLCWQETCWLNFQCGHVCVCVCFPKDFKSHGPQWTKMHVTLVVVSYHLHMILHCERCSNSYTATAVAIDPRRRLLASLQLKCQKWYPWSWSTSFIQLLLDMWSFSTGDTSRWGRKGALCEFGLEPALKHHRSWMTLHASIC